ncbi:MAG: peptidyl-prolyl cis-trans isomerase [Myxococcota bacterium]
MLPVLRRLGREPLLHFVALGGLLFAVHGWVADRKGDDGRDAIVIDPRFVEGLRAEQARRTGSEPTEDETEALLREFVRREALVREARRLGLDEGDPIVRRRLVQKMEFLLEGTVRVSEPTEEELRAYLRAHPDAFRAPSRIGFTHAFFGRDQREDPEGDARRALASLRAGEGRGTEVGDPFLLGRRVGPKSADRIGDTFGRAFAESVAELPEGTWEGPLESAQGWHLVRVTEKRPGGTPAFDDVREQVRAAVLEARRREAYETALAEVIARYPVEQPDEGTR